MRIISFIEAKDQMDVIEKILKHCKLWVEPVERVPPKKPVAVPVEGNIPFFISISTFCPDYPLLPYHRLMQTIPAAHAVSARYCGTVDFSFRKNML